MKGEKTSHFSVFALSPRSSELKLKLNTVAVILGLFFHVIPGSSNSGG